MARSALIINVEVLLPCQGAVVIPMLQLMENVWVLQVKGVLNARMIRFDRWFASLTAFC